jgi:hypothetical protein
MALRNLKRVLLSLIIVGALGSITVHRVYAIFNTELVNAGASITDGTLTLENTVGTGTTCLSLSAATKDNANLVCDQLFTDASLMFPGVPASVNVTIKNSGSLNARTLEVWMASCTKQTSTYVNGTRQNVPVVGSGDPCATNGTEFSIQETQSDFATNVQCWWPNTNTACAAYGSIASFMSTGYTAAPGLRLWNYLVSSPSPALTAGGTTATRYFTITMELPPNASDTLQGEAATFPFVWHEDS